MPSLVPDDEIGYITLHVGAVIERMKQSKKIQQKRAVLVCGNGVGTTNLINIQLTREFPEISIIGNKHAYEVQDLTTNDVDLDHFHHRFKTSDYSGYMYSSHPQYTGF